MSPISFRPAKREAVHLLVGIAGASGAGKSYSALRLARGLAGDRPFCVIDSEARRMLHYADRFLPWDYAELQPPFRPSTYLEAIRTAADAGYPVIVVDSASHEYSGPGGISDWQQEILTKRAGDDYAKRERLSASAWQEPKAAHARFVTDLLQIRAHLVLCFRARQAIEFVREGGKTVIRPTRALDSFEGWLIDTEHTRMPLPFEMTCSFLMVPDRPGVPQPIKLPEQLGPLVPRDRPITEEVGAALGRWAAGVSDDLDKRAPALVSELLSLAEQLGKREAKSEEIAATRARCASAPERYVAWLEQQIGAGKQALEKASAAA